MTLIMKLMWILILIIVWIIEIIYFKEKVDTKSAVIYGIYGLTIIIIFSLFALIIE